MIANATFILINDIHQTVQVYLPFFYISHVNVPPSDTQKCKCIFMMRYCKKFMDCVSPVKANIPQDDP